MSVGTGLLVAVDAGNSKTDALLLDRSGTVLSRARGGGFTPQDDGVDAAMAVLGETLSRLLAGVSGPVDHLAAYLAGADLPPEVQLLHRRIVGQGWARSVSVGNDTLALLRTGAPQGWGVAVVCGAGINAVGIGRDGSVERFPSLGMLTGDWGGGHWLAAEAMWSAIRGEDGRGAATALSAAVAAHFRRPSALDAALAMHLGELDRTRLHELTPTLFDVATGGDPVASALVQRLADEIAAMAAVLIGRLGLTAEPCPVVLGGGVLRSRQDVLLGRIRATLAASCPAATCEMATVEPVVGAALLALNQAGGEPGAAHRLLLAARDAGDAVAASA